MDLMQMLRGAKGPREAAARHPEVGGASDRPRPADEEIVDLLRSTALFDPEWYLLANPDVANAGVDPYRHYVEFGAAEGRSTSALFDAAYYASQFPAGDRPDTPLYHYLRNAWERHRNPSPCFDEAWYVARTGITRAHALTPADHFLRQEPPFPFDPSPSFSNAEYLRTNPDVQSSGMNPLVHYLQSGRSEGRRLARAARWRVCGTPPPLAGRDVLVLAATCPDGTLTPLQREIIATYRSDGFLVVAVVNSGNVNRAADGELTGVADLGIVREDIGFHFGAFAEAVGVLGGLSSLCRSVTFATDAVLPLTAASGRSVRAVLARHPRGIVFMTDSTTVSPHENPSFFTVNGDCLSGGALALMERFARFEIREDAFYGGDLVIGDQFRQEGFETVVAFPGSHGAGADDTAEAAPVVDLAELSRFAAPPAPATLRTLLGDRLAALWEESAASRPLAAPRAAPANAAPVPSIPGAGLRGPLGELQGFNYPPGQNPAVLVPFPAAGERDGSAAAPRHPGRVLSVVHCFYPGIAKRILTGLDELGLDGLVVCTTDTDEKATILRRILARTGLEHEIVVVPNRGRDVAPFLVEGRRFLDGHDHVLHLHTKRSPHHSAYAGWAEFLYENLIGSPEVARSILDLLATGTAGLVYARHFHEVEHLRNWGFDFDHARRILGRIGVDLTVDRILEFPTSTMFWARIDAIRPLFDLGLDYQDFEEENGQIDGTLAHAIERSLLYVCEHTGHEHTMVATRRYRDSDQLVEITSARDLPALEIPRPRLLDSVATTSRFHEDVADCYPVQVKPTDNERPRLNILTPTLEPAQIYGGISSAVHVARRLYEAFGRRVDLRIVFTSDSVSHRGLDEATRRFGEEVVKVWPSADPDCATVVPLAELRACPLSLRAGDIFFATAWWTADLAYRLQRAQRDIFGRHNRVVYLIQDYECGFYAWSSKSVAAKDTYRRGDDTVAIFNSEELANFMTRRFHFPQCWHLPYEINPAIAAALKPVPKENAILVYGRPHAARNLFTTIVEGLRRWQFADPTGRKDVEILFAGEEFDPSLVGELVNAHVLGKLSLEEYARVLGRVAVGISLMESPHPSYPPLEMASSGLITVTNDYADKSMALRSDNIIALGETSPDAVAHAVARALAQAPLGRTCAPSPIRPVPTDVPVLDDAAVAAAVGLDERPPSP